MDATLNGEVKRDIRQHRGVVWCPFCDRSRQENLTPTCDGCGAIFMDPTGDLEDDDLAAPIGSDVPEAITRRRRRTAP